MSLVLPRSSWLLANTDWDLELAQGDIDELWNRFADKISSTYKDNIPVSKSMTKKNQYSMDERGNTKLIN
jgi:hypothetical protein